MPAETLMDGAQDTNMCGGYVEQVLQTWGKNPKSDPRDEIVILEVQ